MSVMSKDTSCGIQDAGFETRTFMPKWGIINERRGQLHEVIRLSGINISIGDYDLPLLIKVASIVGTKVQVYFIENEELYGKKTIKKSRSKNGLHAEFFARGVIETVKKLRWNPDIIHCQGTITHMVPYLLKKLYNDEPTVCHAKVITTLFEKDSIPCLIISLFTLRTGVTEIELNKLILITVKFLLPEYGHTNDPDDTLAESVLVYGKSSLSNVGSSFEDSEAPT